MRLPKILAGLISLVLVAGVSTAVAVRGDDPVHRAPAGVSLAAASSASGRRTSSTSSSVAGPGTSAGLEVPASGVPVGQTSEPFASGPILGGNVVSLPVPTSSSLPPVAALRNVDDPDAVVMLRGPITDGQTSHLNHLNGVSAVEEVDTGTVDLAGDPVSVFGVDPATFRAFTPAASASSERLWQYLAAGSLVSSYEMATDRALKLGAEDVMDPAGSTSSVVEGWMGAFASIGLPGVDLLISNRYASDLGLVPNSGLVVSAPDLSGSQLQSELSAALPGSTIELLHPDQFGGTETGNTLSTAQRQTLISAALSKVGDPYVWGGAGPNVFDCSGLVQWSFRQAGILMPRTADEQFLTGAHIPLVDAQPGDLLFWTYDPNDPGFVDHTAIYLGHDMMVEAPHTGLDVQVVPVPTADFAGAVEVLLS